uniref:Anoctamin transmembrane domain-containing protein n=1 Tax=Chromera velia CCMP2878 TaxID=1169474 RepID=A0A0G4FED9_9ALVE|eukprot:Cvel_16583.t1-p1 / transcript=Cvel_16583.t1 / gene=Cvel_16583 / organism=Chromera_velia_CCMP2878 / gene_product=Anoctamin-10, putative / transcript_product=Anoctamin-10, putative / location=Cvel_scaffold1283:30661-38604(+) / protein_length=822 / sequence_SO=supercontig / SO=protein_coding / is_pseudo=false
MYPSVNEAVEGLLKGPSSDGSREVADECVPGSEVILFLDKETEASTVQALVELFREEKLHAVSGALPDEEPFIALVPTFDRLQREAEVFDLQKKTIAGALKPFEYAKREIFVDGTSPKMFTYSEAAMLAVEAIQGVKGDAFLETREIPSHDGFLLSLQDGGLVSDIMLLHHPEMASTIWKQLLRKTPLFMDVREIRDYLGEEIAIFFLFMRTYLWSLIGLSIPGLYLLALNTSLIELPNGPYFFYACALWSIVTLKVLDQQIARTRIEWGISIVEGSETIRWQFQGEIHTDPHTGRAFKDYPQWKRTSKQLASLGILLVCLIPVVTLMICTLNMMGYLPQGVTGHIGPLYRLSEPGALFDAEDMVKGCIPIVLHAVMVTLLNEAFQNLSERLTEWENYRTQREHEDALLLKRMIFEGLDCYLPLFTLAVILQGYRGLRLELISLFTLDAFRRMGVELVLPWIIQKSRGIMERRRPAAKSLGDGPERTEGDRLPDSLERGRPSQENLNQGGSGGTDDAENSVPLLAGGDAQEEGQANRKDNSMSIEREPSRLPNRRSSLRMSLTGFSAHAPNVGTSDPKVAFSSATALAKESRRSLPVLVQNNANLAVYDGTFDDYMEMVIQYGYITLFAVVFGVGGLCAFLSNFVEVFADLYKLLFVYRRPVPRRCKTLGAWGIILKITLWVSVVSNSWTFTFCHNTKIQDWFDAIAEGMRSRMTHPESLDLFFLSEHLLVALVVVVALVLPSIPPRVTIIEKEFLRESLQSRKSALRKQLSGTIIPQSDSRLLPGGFSVDEELLRRESTLPGGGDADSAVPGGEGGKNKGV